MSEPRTQEAEVSELRKNAKFVTPDGKEICVICHKETDVDFATNISARKHFIEIGGQHCPECCRKYNLC